MTKLKSIVLVLSLLTLPQAAKAGESHSVTLQVSGMTCASCPLTVRQVLKKQPGVSEASVDNKAQTAQVRFDPEKIQPEQLAKALTENGFPATVKR